MKSKGIFLRTCEFFGIYFLPRLFSGSKWRFVWRLGFFFKTKSIIFNMYPSENQHGTWKYPNPWKGWTRRDIHKTTVFWGFYVSTFQGVFFIFTAKIWGNFPISRGWFLQMGWIATTNYSEDPAGDPYEIFWPHIFSKVHRLYKVFKNSKEEDKKDTINWTWNKGEDFNIKMDVSNGNIYVEMRSKVVQGL